MIDYHLENKNLNLNEKNKKLFSDLSLKVKVNAYEEESNVDTFKMYSDFMQEKDGLIEIVNEVINYCTGVTNKINYSTKNISNIANLINYKNRVIMILEHYQEQPGLLDPILNIMVSKIMMESLIIIESLTKSYNENISIGLKCLYQIIYILSKIRGVKTLIKFFPSDVFIFENIILFLINLSLEDSENWCLIYTLILWTSVLSLVPFDIDTIDSNNNIISSLLNYYKKSLGLSGIIRDMTSYAISKFITRPDIIKKGLLESFFEWSASNLSEKNPNLFLILGVYESLFEIFKTGQPNDLIKYCTRISKVTLDCPLQKHLEHSGSVRKLRAKLAQRIGIVLLKPKFQDWRYSIIHKNLLNNLKETSVVTPVDTRSIIKSDQEADELDYDVDFNLLEIIIDHLLINLKDREYIVRWSCAKGLGRLCERLTKTMVDDIYINLFSLFDDEENEYSWQGACLCIAELCKRGMILPDKLEKLMPYLEKALVFEVNKGTFCSGSNVRDSACYVVWALARAYQSKIMKPYVEKLSQTLILVILFDKEVNCRRAASAAFQEHVGRQGYFPHGIEIITEADYFTLGNKNYCYLNIAPFIAQYNEYCINILNYIAFNRLFHPEILIRQLSAETLGILANFNVNYFIDVILTKLIETSVSNSLIRRHGSLLGIGYILVGLKGKWDFENKAKMIRKKIQEGLCLNEKKVLEDSDYRKKFETFYSSIKFQNNIDRINSNHPIRKEILSTIETIDKKNLYKGKGAELMRTAANQFIRLLSEAQITLDEVTFLYYYEVLIDNLKHPNADIQKDAVEAFQNLFHNYDNLVKNEMISSEINSKLKDFIKTSVYDESVYITKGFTSALPFFHKIFIQQHFKEIIDALMINSKLKKLKNEDADTRKFAIESLYHISNNFLISKNELIYPFLQKIIDQMLEGLEDYEIDNKLGDVGSKVREASMKSLTKLFTCIYHLKDEKMIEKYLNTNIYNYLSGLIKQSMEKMNKIRLCAGESLQEFFYEIKEFKNLQIPYFEELKTMYLFDLQLNEFGHVKNSEWQDPSYSFKKLSKIMTFKDYSFSFVNNFLIIKFDGIVISIGGITEDVVKYSIETLDEILKSSNYDLALIEMIYSHIIKMLKKYQKVDRVIEPLFNTISIILSKPVFINSKFIEYIDEIHKSSSKENYESKNIHKILNSVDIFYNLLFFESNSKVNIYTKSMKSLLFLMNHSFPVVRKKTAEKIYTFFLTIDDGSIFSLSSEDIETVLNLLSETNWTQPVKEIKEQRNLIADILKIQLK